MENQLVELNFPGIIVHDSVDLFLHHKVWFIVLQLSIHAIKYQNLV